MKLSVKLPAGQEPEENGLLALRQDIDATDRQLLELLNRRAELSLEVGKLKAASGAPVFRPAREAALLNKLSEMNGGPLPSEHLRAIYREILSSSRALQRPASIACLGPEGTFSAIAAREYFGSSCDVQLMPHFGGIFDAVQKGKCDYGLVPIENSLNGTVGQTLDLFATHEVFVQAEWFSRIRLSLLSREEKLSAIQTVYSHPQPLGQCAGWLREQLPHARQVSLPSTAVAASRCIGEPGSAAIGDERLAVRMGLHVLERDLQDQPDNWTRFFVIGDKPASEDAQGANRLSVMFSLPNKSGSLARVLAIFSRHGLNMSKLESRPLKSERWNYIFFADLDCGQGNQHEAFVETAKECLSWRVLGTYPDGRQNNVVI